MEQRTTYITIRIDFSHDGRFTNEGDYDNEDINAMAGDIVVNNALAHIHTKENGIIIDNIENCGVNN